ncbi:MAG TPA: methyltransferase domain-containing protein [Ktedonobacterales bacterium]|nr:methyltransferase domain-containing protein [Ktedonobacterales bacterium]
MHSFARHQHRPSGESVATTTKGLILSGGWRYDLHGWFLDAFLFRGQGRALRRKTLTLARLQPGEQVLDVGCGTGTLALEVAQRVGSTGRVVGIDPGEEQIARARAKAARRHLSIEFEVGVIEQLAFSNQTFDVVLSTLMLHHLPAPLKRQGLVEIARVLKPGGRLVIADFTRKQDRAGLAARFHAGGSGLQDVVSLLEEAGFSQVETEELPSPHFTTFPGASLIRASIHADERVITEREG